MSPPGVSVIVVNWNAGDMVLQLLARLSREDSDTELELELIVVDNDSSDGSGEAIRLEFPSVKLVAQTANRGFAGGFNPGLQVAAQPLVLLLIVSGVFDEDYFLFFEETDFCVRARRLGERVVHAPVGEFRHEDGGTSKSVRLRMFLEFRRSELLFHRKHGGVGAALAARGLLALGSALRVPSLAALSMIGASEQARSQLALNLKGLRWLVSPSGGLVPEVDRSE
jgi:GT2 family glycosyltransferase